MFARLNLKLDENDLNFNSDFRHYGLGQYTIHKQTICQSLDKYLSPDGVLDASAIEDDWFPQVDAKVFLSHSHIDEEVVIRFAGFLLENYSITSFIDSTVWGYADDLLKKIDERYCVKSRADGTTYSYEKRNQSTAHVHMILQGALAKMINQCECLIFVNTPSSLRTKDIGDVDTTSSPWIYSELLMANTFPARPPQYYNILKSERADSIFEHADLKVKYKVGLTDFVDIDLDDIQTSANKASSKTARKVLDQIYLDQGLMISDSLMG